MKFNCQKVGKTTDGSIEFILNKKYKSIITDGYFKIVARNDKNKIVADGNDLNDIQESINNLIYENNMKSEQQLLEMKYEICEKIQTIADKSRSLVFCSGECDVCDRQYSKLIAQYNLLIEILNG